MNFIKADYISLKKAQDLTEAWVQKLIAEDPTILGLGDLILRDKERVQPKAGRLDLLLQDPDTKRRYEVEVQLGATDESHLIRTLEYWDIERKRYPQYEHCAVIVAEEITSRFLNVISLFNGFIPLIAIKMSALKVGDNTTLVFTKVLDELTLGVIDEDEEEQAISTDRDYWEKKGSKTTVGWADALLKYTHEIDPQLEMNFNKHYIGINRNNMAFNFIAFRPKKSRLNLEIKIPKNVEIDALIEKTGFDTLEYGSRYQLYRLSLSKDDITNHKEQLLELFKLAYERRTQ